MWYFQPHVSLPRLKTLWKFTFSPLEITLGENPNRFCTQKKIKEIGVYIYLGGLINKCGQKIYDTAFLFLSIRILMKRSLVTHKMKSQRRCNLSALLVVLVNTSKSKAFFLYLIFLFDDVVLYSTAKLNAGLYLHSHPWIHFRKCLLPLTGMKTNNYIEIIIKNIIGYLYKGKYTPAKNAIL